MSPRNRSLGNRSLESKSRAVGQRSLGPTGSQFPLLPVQLEGCPIDSTDTIQYPLEISYDTSAIDPSVFAQPGGPGLDRWQAVLPPIADGLSLGEGGTPLVTDRALADFARYDGEVFFKCESANPTGSHKDRLNLCTISAAVASGSDGIVVASSGNHAISAAAYAQRAGLACVALVSDSLDGASAAWLAAYNAAAVRVPREMKWPLLRAVREQTGFHPVSNLTDTHTGNPYGPEGYKTMAYELLYQLNGAGPAAVFVPTGYGEMLFGLHRGFQDLRNAGLIERLPALIACEPAARGPLHRAMAEGLPAAKVDANPTIAGGIACRVSSYRGVVAVTESNGQALLVTDDELRQSGAKLRERSMWHEWSCGASLAGLRQWAVANPSGEPVVCILPSQGVKTYRPATSEPELPHASDLAELDAVLTQHYNISL